MLFCLALIACKSTQVEADHDQYFYALLDEVSAQPRKETRGPDIISRLQDIKTKSKSAGASLIDLLDYYIGEGPGAIQREYIAERGRDILPLLEAKRNKPLECLPKYKTICLDHFKDGLKLRNLMGSGLGNKVLTGSRSFAKLLPCPASPG
ncbi:MAG: hypothetical protein ACYC7L_09345 [Nitrospirota bacterium]